MGRLNEDAEESPFSLARDKETVHVTYRNVPFTIKALYSQPHGVWTAYVTSEAISSSIFPTPPTFATRDEALVTLLKLAMVSLDTALDPCDPLLQQLWDGQPVDLQSAGPVADLARQIAEALLARDDIDQNSDEIRRFRQAFDQSI